MITTTTTLSPYCRGKEEHHCSTWACRIRAPQCPFPWWCCQEKKGGGGNLEFASVEERAACHRALDVWTGRRGKHRLNYSGRGHLRRTTVYGPTVTGVGIGSSTWFLDPRRLSSIAHVVPLMLSQHLGHSHQFLYEGLKKWIICMTNHCLINKTFPVYLQTTTCLSIKFCRIVHICKGLIFVRHICIDIHINTLSLLHHAPPRYEWYCGWWS